MLAEQTLQFLVYVNGQISLLKFEWVIQTINCTVTIHRMRPSNIFALTTLSCLTHLAAQER